MHLTWQDLTVLYLPVTKDITKSFICEPPYRNGDSLHQKELDPRVNVILELTSLKSLAYTTCLKYNRKSLSWECFPVKWSKALRKQLALNTVEKVYPERRPLWNDSMPCIRSLPQIQLKTFGFMPTRLVNL